MKKRNEKNQKHDIYVSFSARTIVCAILFIIFFSGGLLLFLNSLNFNEQRSINYTEKSNLDYKVYLKENDFYDTSYLEKNMLYIASLIDKVSIDFNYSFTSDENIDLYFDYKIVGKLSIMDTGEDNTYFEKEYILLDNKNFNMDDGNTHVINEKIDIDYGYYNSLANKFKMNFGVDTSSNFTIYLIINKNNANAEEEVIINNVSHMSIMMPLSERAVNIKMNYNEIDNTNKLISKSNIIIDNIIFMIISFVLLIVSIFTLIKLIRFINLLNNNKSKYDKYIKKLLKEYDRLIVETSTCPIINEENVIKINKFQELLDVRDNLKLPIMYYVVTKHQKCYFYITYNEKIYLTVIKKVDIE